MSEDDNLHRGSGRDGGYEVWFLTFTERETGAGYWIRSTLRSATNGERGAGVWFARFDPAEPASTFGIHRRVAAPEAVPEDRFEVRLEGAEMRSGHAEGAVAAGGHSARWRLSYPTGEPTYRMLPDVMYRGGIAPTKPYSPNPSTKITGTMEVDGESFEVRDAPGQQGHLVGARHAMRWAWAQCGDFEGEETVVHALTATTRRGPFTTPYLTSVGILWEGRWIRLTKLSRRRDFGLGTWRVDMESRRYRLTGRIEAPATALLRARYEDPDGTPRYCHNTEIASCRLALFERKAGGFDEIALLESRGTTHAEWAGMTPAPQVERDFVEVGP